MAKTKQYCISLSDELLAKLNKYCESKNINKSAIIKLAIAEYLEKNGN